MSTRWSHSPYCTFTCSVEFTFLFSHDYFGQDCAEFAFKAGVSLVELKQCTYVSGGSGHLHLSSSTIFGSSLLPVRIAMSHEYAVVVVFFEVSKCVHAKQHSASWDCEYSVQSLYRSLWKLCFCCPIK